MLNPSYDGFHKKWQFLRYITKKLCTACTRTSYKIVPVTNLNKYLHNDTGETEVIINESVNNSSEKLLKKKKPVLLSVS
jgi:hypothetical protein